MKTVEEITDIAQLDPTLLHLVLATDEDSEDDPRPIFVAGNFNGWTTQDERFRMTQVRQGLYYISFPADFAFPGELLYKFTRGDWSEVEIDRYGTRTENRSTSLRKGIVREHVPRWRHNWLPFKKEFLPQIHLLSEDFEIPQLHKRRRVWALLPHDYDHTDERYPVMYLQDAQNLFNENSPYGNWEIDKKLAVMADYNIGKLIVIAIEHAEGERILEFTMGMTVFGQGQGEQYIRFLAETLKPFVDTHLRTKPERAFTGIGGSSMGGLVSIFGGILCPQIFGRLLIFSPSLWVVPQLVPSFLDKEDPQPTRIYLYAGGEESARMVQRITQFKKQILKQEKHAEKAAVHLSIHPQGKHSEVFWSDEFPKAIEWLFFSDKTE